GDDAKLAIEVDDLTTGERFRECDALRQKRDLASGTLHRRRIVADQHLASRGSNQSRRRLQRCRLAGAVGTEKRDRFATLDCQRYGLNGDLGSETLREAAEGDH